MVPLRELVLAKAVPPIPNGGPIVDVAVCGNCMASGREWIGLAESFRKHAGKCHRVNGVTSAHSIPCKAQKVGVSIVQVSF